MIKVEHKMKKRTKKNRRLAAQARRIELIHKAVDILAGKYGPEAKEMLIREATRLTGQDYGTFVRPKRGHA